jgi:hypothetical protein
VSPVKYELGVYIPEGDILLGSKRVFFYPVRIEFTVCRGRLISDHKFLNLIITCKI